jgi:hypothetical protein
VLSAAHRRGKKWTAWKLPLKYTIKHLSGKSKFCEKWYHERLFVRNHRFEQKKCTISPKPKCDRANVRYKQENRADLTKIAPG